MAISDKTITCVVCRNEFNFTVGEQEFFASRGFNNEPKRCSRCREAHKSQQGGYSDSYVSAREMHPAVCAQCGSDTMVPFRPRGDKPVYCSDCFSGMSSRS